MEVTLLRHGIAVDRNDPRSPPDPERPLTLEGKQRTELAARGLKAMGLKPQVILTSPYLRCAQTARLIGNGLALSRKSILTMDALLPTADPRALWPELERLGRDAVLCVGHGGALEPCAGVALGLPTLTPETPDIPDLAFRTLQLKKAGAMQLDVTFAPTLSAKLNWLLSPKLIRQLGRA
jgi:phosphohistidine phosphatase